MMETMMDPTMMEASVNGSLVNPVLGTAYFIVMFVFALIVIVSGWKVFEKAKLPGWGVLIPFYNIYLFFKMAGVPAWAWSMIFPPVMGILMLIANFKVAEKFGKDAGFGAGLAFLGFIFYPMLAFGDAEYKEETSTPQN